MPLTRNQSNAASQAKLSAAEASETGTSKDNVDQGGTSAESEPPRRDSPENCSICLGPFNNKSFTSSCAHSFCFVCLKQWSKVKAECPLCKQPFTSIFHNIRSNQHYDIYELPHQPTNQIDYNIFNYGPFPSFTAGPPTPLFNLTQPAFDADLTLSNFSRFQFRHRRYFNPLSIHGEHPYSFSGPTINPSTHYCATTWPRGAEEFRREVYRRNIGPPAVILGCENSTYRLTPAMVSASAHRVHRIMPWLTRELRVLLRSHQNVRLAISVIQPLLTQVTIDSIYFYDKVVPLIGHRSRQFVQEFVAFANSALSMQAFDRKAMYRRREVAPAVPSSSSSPSSENDVVEVTDISPDVYPSSSVLGSSQVQPLNLNRSGWDSPTPGPSWSSSNVPNCPASVIDRVSVSSESDDPVYRPDLRDSDTNESRPGSDIIFVKYDKPWNERSPIQLTSDSDGGGDAGTDRARKKKKAKHKKKKKEVVDNLETSGIKKDKTKKSSKSKHRDKSKGSSKAASEEEKDSAACSKRRHSQSSTEQHKVKKHKKSKRKEKLSDREIVDRYFAEAMASHDKEGNPTGSEVKESDVPSKRKDKEKVGTSSGKEKAKKKKKSRKHSKDSHNQSYTHTYKKHHSGHKKSSNRLPGDPPELNRHHLRRSPVRGDQAAATGRSSRHETVGNDNLSQHEGSNNGMSHSLVPGFQPPYLSMADTVQHIPVNLWVSTWPTLSVSHNYPPPPPPISMGQNIPQGSNASSLASNPSGAGPSRYGLDMLSISSDSSSDSSDSESDDAQDLHIPSLQNVHSRTKQWLETNFPDLGRPQASSSSAPTSSTTSSSANDNLASTSAMKKAGDDPSDSQIPLEEISIKEKELDVEVVSIPSGEEDVVVCSSDDSDSNIDDLWVIDDQTSDKASSNKKTNTFTVQSGSQKNDEIPSSTCNISTLPFSGDITKSQSSIPSCIILPPTHKSFQPFKVKKPTIPLIGKDPFFPSMTHSSDEDVEVDTILQGVSSENSASQIADSSIPSLNKSEITNANNLEDLIASIPPATLSLSNAIKEPVQNVQGYTESSSHSSIFQPQNSQITLSTSLTSSYATDSSPIFSVLPSLTSSNSTTSGINYLPYSNTPTSMSSMLPRFMPQQSVAPQISPLSLSLPFPFTLASAQSNTIVPSTKTSQNQEEPSPLINMTENANTNLHCATAQSSKNNHQSPIDETSNKIRQESHNLNVCSSHTQLDYSEGKMCGILGSSVNLHNNSKTNSENESISNEEKNYEHCGTMSRVLPESGSKNDTSWKEEQDQSHFIDFLDSDSNVMPQIALNLEEKQKCAEPESCLFLGEGDREGLVTNNHLGNVCNSSELHKVNEFDFQVNYDEFESKDTSTVSLNNIALNGVSKESLPEQNASNNMVVKPFDALESLSTNVTLPEGLVTTVAPLNASHSRPTGKCIVTTEADRFEQSVLLNSAPTEPTLQHPVVVSSNPSREPQFVSYLPKDATAVTTSRPTEDSHDFSYSDNENSLVHPFTDALQSSETSSASSDSEA